jgi:hypothetical protein
MRDTTASRLRENPYQDALAFLNAVPFVINHSLRDVNPEDFRPDYGIDVDGIEE